MSALLSSCRSGHLFFSCWHLVLLLVGALKLCELGVWNLLLVGLRLLYFCCLLSDENLGPALFWKNELSTRGLLLACCLHETNGRNKHSKWQRDLSLVVKRAGRIWPIRVFLAWGRWSHTAEGGPWSSSMSRHGEMTRLASRTNYICVAMPSRCTQAPSRGGTRSSGRMHLIIALIFPCKPIGNREDTPHSQPKQTMALDL